ncbi:uncharacterized protein A1O5_09583 [Cladophialophora psammophila CBS 110553]|uniref:Alpha/beta hydrolase fold-3 domain-containing protein n=1 Tax=Cladophialophora psammophila CBS 110553 TaxID=1182543 RepID=W9WRF1_9EURO|nr:uncharacterized protein A1O5_09583 [Cladophialophora psammophila CBS 110553]EXJ67570.1 hypothetical protein A1O5_09583 [Cladophialophora psammophila CBS 110553]
MSPVVKQALCNAERLQLRLLQTDQYLEAKKHMVHYWACSSREQYTLLEREGKGVFDLPTYDPEAFQVLVPSSFGDHNIPLRVIQPRGKQAGGVFLFIHGGGFVIGSAALHDNLLRDLAERTNLVMVSVEYRLAPEFKLPAAADDCLDAAVYLMSDEARMKIGHTLQFIGGESAGAYLTVQTTLRLRDEKSIDVGTALAGIVPTYGIFDLSLLPGVRLGREKVGDAPNKQNENFMWLSLPVDAFGSLDEIKKSAWSPLYNVNLRGLPPATFGVGAEDPLIDDSILMAAKWELAGNEAELIVYPGSPHGYLVVDLDVTAEAIEDIVKFVKARLT